jgi:UDP-glucose 4-epimerase
VYVEDVAKALVKSLEAASENKVFNKIVEAGPRTSHTVNEVATMVRDTVAQLTRKAPVRITHLPMRPGETPNARVTADTTTLKQIHMNPDEMVSLQDGINSTVQYFIRERGITWQEPGVV